MNNFFRQLFYGIDNLTNQQQNIINTYGNNNIIKIIVYRKPVSKILKNILNFISFGKFLNNLKKSPYDEIYHLFMIITLDNNINILIEKNERINIKILNNIDILNLNNDNYTQKIDIIINNKIIFYDLLYNTYKIMGNNFYIYDSSIFNCQNFILSILKSNNIYQIEYDKFIYQDPNYFFYQLNYLKKFNKNITDIASKINLIKTGSGIDDKNINKIVYNNEKYKYNSNKNKKKNIKLINDNCYIVFYSE